MIFYYTNNRNTRSDSKGGAQMLEELKALIIEALDGIHDVDLLDLVLRLLLAEREK